MHGEHHVSMSLHQTGCDNFNIRYVVNSFETRGGVKTRPSALGMSDPIVEPLEIMGTQESSKVLEGPFLSLKILEGR